MRRRKRMIEDLDQDIREHVAIETQDNIERGMSPEEARYAALRKFGNVTRVQEETREVWSSVWMEQLWQDIRYGIRMLAKNPGFTAIAVLTLALGIGANTTIFSVMNAVMLRPLSYKDSGRLVQVWEKNPKRNIPEFTVSPANFLDWRDHNNAFEQMAVIANTAVSLTGGGTPEREGGVAVSPSLFSLLGVQPEHGRTFTAGEDTPTSAHVVVISHGLWEQRLGGDPNLAGKKLTLDGIVYEVVGVMPPGFSYPYEKVSIWTPLVLDEKTRASRGGHWLSVIARLKTGVSLAQARAEMDTIADQLAQQYPGSNAGWGVLLRPLQKEVIGDIGPALLVLMGAVAFVLLIACGNVANLLLARASERGREMALRAALGASRKRIVCQLLTESLLLALAGGALGLLIAYWGTDLLLKLDTGGIPRQSEIGVDGIVLGFTLAVTFLAALLFGLAPAFQVSRVDLNRALKEGTRNLARGGGKLRRLLVISEVALALVILVGGGLLVRSFARLIHVNPGFRPENVLTFQVGLPEAKYPKKEDGVAFFQQLLRRVQNLPGVESAGAISFLPLSGVTYNLAFYPEGQPPLPGAVQTWAEFRVATPGYFRTMVIPLRKGRVFTDADAQGTPLVAVINEAMARQFWPNADPIGKHIIIGDRNPAPREIVGIVGDVREVGLNRASKPEMFVSELQKGEDNLAVVICSQLPPTSLVHTAQEQVQFLDKDLPIYHVSTMDQALGESVGDQRFSAYLFVVFALLALVLAAAGVYGVMSHIVAQGTREIGIRLALGAQPQAVLGKILHQGMVIVTIGLAIGTVAALALTRIIAGLLYGVSPFDAATFIAVTVLLIGVAMSACYFPARRAMRVDPMVALRYE